jgi:hypothetical protein
LLCAPSNELPPLEDTIKFLNSSTFFIFPAKRINIFVPEFDVSGGNLNLRIKYSVVPVE